MRIVLVQAGGKLLPIQSRMDQTELKKMSLPGYLYKKLQHCYHAIHTGRINPVRDIGLNSEPYFECVFGISPKS